ncbi:cytochrome P450 [Pendulispora brunnea]|uniref:Cytochrome P450 n=1 Tax=Pendulispora brunnea TaxID=2905690 RepID=A0ABZ2JU29_9BACT
MMDVPQIKGGLPLLGHSIDLLRAPFAFFLEARAAGDVVEIRLGSQRVFVLNAPHLIRQVLVTDKERFDEGSVFENAWGRFGSTENLGRVTATRVGDWLPGQLVAVDEEMRDITLTAMSPEWEKDRLPEWRDAMPLVLKQITRQTFSPFAWLAGKKMRSILPEEVVRLIASTEVRASTLSWALHHIGQHPLIEKRLHEEVDGVLPGRDATVEDVPRLPYLRRVLCEAMRMHPLALVVRRARSDVVLGGHRYPEGTRFFISPHALHRDPRCFVAPQRFDPDRWRPERAAAIKRECYIPSVDPGDAWALADMAIVLATVARRWRLVPAADHTVRETLNGVTQVDALPMIADAR